MGPVGLVDPWVWWGCWSGGPGGTVGLVGPWVWWACVSGGPVGLVGPWVNFKGSDMPRCPWSSFRLPFLTYDSQFLVKIDVACPGTWVSRVEFFPINSEFFTLSH